MGSGLAAANDSDAPVVRLVNLIIQEAINLRASKKGKAVKLHDWNPLGHQFIIRFNHVVKPFDNPKIRLAALFEGQARDFVEVAREAQADIAAPNYRLITKEQVAKAHAAGLQVVPWTPNRPEEWQVMVDAGVDAIITDDPAELIAFLKKTNARR